ncbi:MAG: hypothetical protein ABFE13_17160 [Phycisphaerales bacterium]
MSSRIVTGLRRSIESSFKDPVSTAQLAATGLLIIAVLVTLWCWGHDRSRSASEVPLLVMGVVAILLIVLRTTHGFTLSVAVLIIGTVVAGDRFMLAVTALLRGEPKESMTFVKDLYVEHATHSIQTVDPNQVARLIVDLMGEKGKPEQATTVVAGVLERARIAELVREVQREGAETPLRWLKRNDEDWAERVREYREYPEFLQDVECLRRLGLISYSGSRLEDARLTSSGQQVLRYLDEEPGLLLRSAVARLPSKRVAGPNDPVIRLLTPDSPPLQGRFVDTCDDWFRLDVRSHGGYRIETSQADLGPAVDTVLSLLRPDLETQIAEDDDGAADMFSRLEVHLDPGTYFLRVSSFNGTPGGYSLVVTSRSTPDED